MNPGFLYKGMWIEKERRCGEYLSKRQANKKADLLSATGNITIIKSVPFGNRKKYIIFAAKRGAPCQI